MKLLSKLSTTSYSLALIVVIALSLQSCLNSKNESSWSSIDFATYTNLLGTPIFMFDNGKSITPINEGADKLTNGTTLVNNDRVLIVTHEISQESFIGENEIHAKVNAARLVKEDNIQKSETDYTDEYLKENSQSFFLEHYNLGFYKLTTDLNNKRFNFTINSYKLKDQENPRIHLVYTDESYSIDDSSLTLYLLVDKLPEDSKLEKVAFQESISFNSEELLHFYSDVKKINIKHVEPNFIKTQVYTRIGEDEFNWYRVNNTPN